MVSFRETLCCLCPLRTGHPAGPVRQWTLARSTWHGQRLHPLPRWSVLRWGTRLTLGRQMVTWSSARHLAVSSGATRILQGGMIGWSARILLHFSYTYIYLCKYISLSMYNIISFYIASNLYIESSCLSRQVGSTFSDLRLQTGCLLPLGCGRQVFLSRANKCK
jgi:hypothetical protein